MPLYEYRCTQCSYRYEKIQKVSDEPDTVCAKCGGTVERPLAAPALQFKGAGWYINDYAPKAATSSSSGEKPAAESGTKTESKPAAAESKPAASESAPKPASTTTSTT